MNGEGTIIQDDTLIPFDAQSNVTWPIIKKKINEALENQRKILETISNDRDSDMLAKGRIQAFKLVLSMEAKLAKQ